MSDLTSRQWEALHDAYTTLRAVYEVYKSTDPALAANCAQSMANLTTEFPQVARLEEHITANQEPRP